MYGGLHDPFLSPIFRFVIKIKAFICIIIEYISKQLIKYCIICEFPSVASLLALNSCMINTFSIYSEYQFSLFFSHQMSWENKPFLF